MFNDYQIFHAKQIAYKGIVFILIIIFIVRIEASSKEKDIHGKLLQETATFHFPEYAYKETSRNEITYREFEAACEQKGTCEEYEGVVKIGCLRRCISNSCYNDIYAFDELEVGEIDVRLNSFKGCVIQRTGHCNHLHQEESVMRRLSNAPIYHEFEKQFQNILKYIYY